MLACQLESRFLESGGHFQTAVSVYIHIYFNSFNIWIHDCELKIYMVLFVNFGFVSKSKHFDRKCMCYIIIIFIFFFSSSPPSTGLSSQHAL